MKIRSLTVLTCMLCIFFIAACSLANDSNPDENQTNQRDEKDRNRTEEVEKQIITDLGIYVGQADQNTIEIETNEGPKAFRLTEQMKDQIKELEPNDKVRFEYYINQHQQNILKKIEKMNDKRISPEAGAYNGQQD